MLDETTQTAPTVLEVRNRRFSGAVRLTMMLPRAASGGSLENKGLSQEEHIEARALAARYPSFSQFCIKYSSLWLAARLRLSPSYAEVLMKSLSLAKTLRH